MNQRTVTCSVDRIMTISCRTIHTGGMLSTWIPQSTPWKLEWAPKTLLASPVASNSDPRPNFRLPGVAKVLLMWVQYSFVIQPANSRCFKILKDWLIKLRMRFRQCDLDALAANSEVTCVSSARSRAKTVAPTKSLTFQMKMRTIFLWPRREQIFSAMPNRRSRLVWVAVARLEDWFWHLMTNNCWFVNLGASRIFLAMKRIKERKTYSDRWKCKAPT